MLDQSYEDTSFWGKKWPSCPKENFFIKTTDLIFMYLLAPFIVQNFKEILTATLELW